MSATAIQYDFEIEATLCYSDPQEDESRTIRVTADSARNALRHAIKRHGTPMCVVVPLGINLQGRGQIHRITDQMARLLRQKY